MKMLKKESMGPRSVKYALGARLILTLPRCPPLLARRLS